LGFPGETDDPFLFCVPHDDAYPKGNAQLGPAASLAGRNIGQDFEGKDGWRMYHGDVVPGFPQHPHRGFETVTIVHAEMFPLVRPDAPNPLELFQIWLNLPGADKLVAPHFSMLWRESIPS